MYSTTVVYFAPKKLNEATTLLEQFKLNFINFNSTKLNRKGHFNLAAPQNNTVSHKNCTKMTTKGTHKKRIIFPVLASNCKW